ncbi:MAG: lipoyl(octanoyl) transferase LipB [Rudaea sp.]
MNKVWLVNLGTVGYAEALELQHRLVDARKRGELNDLLLLLEHTPVFTLGRNGRDEHILASREYLDQVGIEVFRVERGGDVTYHGPRQLVGYPILDLHNFRMDVGWYVKSLEQVLIQTVNEFGLSGRRVGADGEGRDSKLVGVWIDNPAPEPLVRQVQPDAKIAQIGARIESWITYHGFALNVDPIMQHFELIVPCGISDKPVTSMALALGRPVGMEAVRETVARNFKDVFKAGLEPLEREELENRLDEALQR